MKNTKYMMYTNEEHNPTQTPTLTNAVHIVYK